jgi:integrase
MTRAADGDKRLQEAFEARHIRTAKDLGIRLRVLRDRPTGNLTLGGSIYQRTDGLWVAEIDLGVVDGKRKRKQLYAQTRKDVVEKLKDCQLALHQGISINLKKQTVGQFLDRWVQDAATPRLRPRTLAGYKLTIQTHLKPLLGGFQLRELTGQHVQALIGSKVDEGLSPRTIRGIRAVLRSALSDAVKWRIVQFNAAKAASLRE